jgi:hypothetical protein
MRANDPTEKTRKVDDERVVAVEPLPPPEQLIRFFPVAGGPIEGFVASSRDQVRRSCTVSTTGCWWWWPVLGARPEVGT